MRTALENVEPGRFVGVIAVMYGLAINWDAVLLAVVVAVIVLSLLTSLILKEINRHR